MNIKKLLLAYFLINQITYTAGESDTYKNEYIKCIKSIITTAEIENKLQKYHFFKFLLKGSWAFIALQYGTAKYYKNDQLSTFLAYFIGAYAVFTYNLWTYVNNEEANLEKKAECILSQIPEDLLKELAIVINENTELTVTLTVP